MYLDLILFQLLLLATALSHKGTLPDSIIFKIVTKAAFKDTIQQIYQTERVSWDNKNTAE